MSLFSTEKQTFDNTLGTHATLAAPFVTVDGKHKTGIAIRNADGKPLEEYYKWQFLYAVVYSGLYQKDYIGTEVRLPKGNKTSAPLRLDAAIFDSPDWLVHYNAYWQHTRSEDLEWLREHLMAVVEFKRGDKEIEKVVSGQVVPAMKEKEPGIAYVLGIYYDTERLYLFHRRNGLSLRYDEGKNQKGSDSKIGDLSLHLPDEYGYLPSFVQLQKRINRPATFDRSGRTIEDLEVITSIATVQPQDALSSVLRVMDQNGLTNQRGYQIFIETFTLKIYDEKRNSDNLTRTLEFYVSQQEGDFASLAETPIQKFIGRMKAIYDEAEGHYLKILSENVIDWKNIQHVRVVVAVCRAFQDFSFMRSAANDLYQLVFYNFANKFTQSEAAQFLTPLPVIDFLVKIVNPCNGETVIDPCCGIGDFLSLAFVNSRHKDQSLWLKDANIYGVDLHNDMIMLATLNMLLNGDGEAKFFQQADDGSILHKVQMGNDTELAKMLPAHHKAGTWDAWPDNTKLRKFDVVLTNPPFGRDRAYRASTAHKRAVIEMYETWDLSGGTDSMDLGVVFLENAYRLLKDEGRLGIVLSNSIASINEWAKVREWLMTKMRIVALFDLPENVFAETGVNTSIIVAYKPKAADLARLTTDGYSIFVRDIHAVGYEKRTSKRNVFFNPVYRINEATFDVETDAEGRPMLDEDFSGAIADFRTWGRSQEAAVQKLFLREA